MISFSNSVSVKPLQLNKELEKLQLTAFASQANNAIDEKPLSENPINEISDIQISKPALIAAAGSKTKREIRVENRKNNKEKFRLFFNELRQNKPALALGVAALVCSLVGLLIFGLPLGILSIVF